MCWSPAPQLCDLQITVQVVCRCTILIMLTLLQQTRMRTLVITSEIARGTNLTYPTLPKI